jgi:Zn-dependent M28 family amino/carboxypeptidase
LHGWPTLEPYFGKIAESIGMDIPVWQELNPYSDHWPFLLKGRPTATMGDPEEAKRRGGRGFGHTIYDTVDKADLRAQRECAANSALAATRIANSDEWPVHHRNQVEIEDLLSRQGYQEILVIGKQLKKYLHSRENQLRPETKAFLRRLGHGWKEIV